MNQDTESYIKIFLIKISVEILVDWFINSIYLLINDWLVDWLRITFSKEPGHCSRLGSWLYRKYKSNPR